MKNEIQHFNNIIKLWKQKDIVGIAALSLGNLRAKKRILEVSDDFSRNEIGDYLHGERLLWKAYSEEAPGGNKQGVVYDPENPTHWLFIDPVDGSLNAAVLVEAKQAEEEINEQDFPFGLLLALVEAGAPHSLVAAAMHVEPFNSSYFYDDGVTIDEEGQVIKLKRKNSKKNTLKVGVSRGTEKQLQANPIDRIEPVAPGSLVGVLSMLLTRQLDAIVVSEVGFEEIAVLYGLIVGSGGIVVDEHGQSIQEEKMIPGVTHTVFAGRKNVVRELLVQELLINRLIA